MTARITAGDVNDRIDREIMPELRKNTTLLEQFKVKLDMLNGPTREAMVALAKVSHVLIELATDRTKQDELLAARELLRTSSRHRVWLKRTGKAILWLTPWMVALGQLAGLLPSVAHAIHR